MWRNEEKLLFFRSEKLEKRLRQKGKSPLPEKKKIVFFRAQKLEKRLTDGGKWPLLVDRVWHSFKKVTRIYTMY